MSELTCGECGHATDDHTEVTNDGCLVDGCPCERDPLAAWYGILHGVTCDNATPDGPCLLVSGHDGSCSPDPSSPFADLEDENADLRMVLGASSGELARLRKAIEDFIAWWDSPPYVLDDDDGLRMMVDDLRAALRGEQP